MDQLGVEEVHQMMDSGPEAADPFSDERQDPALALALSQFPPPEDFEAKFTKYLRCAAPGIGFGIGFARSLPASPAGAPVGSC